MHWNRMRRTGSTRDPFTQGCSVPACDQTHYGLGFCEKHYLRSYRDRIRSEPKLQCSVEGCEGRRVTKLGLCQTHWRRLKSHGSVHCNGKPTVEERFLQKVDKSAGPDGCWPWLGTRKKEGYGGFSFYGKRRPATHISFYLMHGRFPASDVLRHKCDNPPCVNPAHLIEGTYADNSRDMVERGRWRLPKKPVASEISLS